MPGYRLYTFEKDGHIATPPREFDCSDDLAAVQEAKKVLDGHAIEVWEKARLVIRLQPKRE